MPIPPQLWLSQDNDTKGVAETAPYDNKDTKEVTLIAELVYSDHGAENTNQKERKSHNRGTCLFFRVRNFFSLSCFSDIIHRNDLKRRQEEETAIRRVGFVFLAYNVEFWY